MNFKFNVFLLIFFLSDVFIVENGLLKYLIIIKLLVLRFLIIKVDGEFC